MDVRHILERFEQLEEHSDGGFLACCSAHADSDPSLRIWVDDVKVRFHCRAGCKTLDVLRAVGLTWRHLYDVDGNVTRVSSTKAAPVDTEHLAPLHMYLDACSRRLAGAERYLQNRFNMNVSQAASLGVGFDPGYGFAYTGPRYTAHPRLVVPLHSFDGIARGAQGRDTSGNCPYRWVGLSNPPGAYWGRYGWFAGGRDVVVTEGPSDGLTAASLGQSVLIIRGASVAANADLQAELRTGLAGRRVYVAADPDAAGRRFAASVGEATGGDAQVFLMKLRGGDLSDWTQARRNPSSALDTLKRNATPVSAAGKPINKARASRMDAYLDSLLGG